VFPPRELSPKPSRRKALTQVVNRGMDKANGVRAVMCGLARNLGEQVETARKHFDRTTGIFDDYRIVLFENDSEDDTLQRLQHWADQDCRVDLLSQSLSHPINPPTRCLQRVERMAYYRNLVRSHIIDNYGDYDYVVVADTDIRGGWPVSGVASTFGFDDWDFMGANGLYKHPNGELLYYDNWAFRPLGQEQARPPGNYKAVYINGDPPLPVNSCFGGLGVYRMDALLRCAYSGGDCEHVTFHRKMRHNGMDRLFLNPSMLVLYNDVEEY